MKLRIKGNSIRFRLLRSEIDRLVTDGSVSESTMFGPTDALRYTVKTDPNAKAPIAILDHGEIVVSLPSAVAQKWATSDEVSIATVQPTGNEPLDVLIEKDFVCLDRIGDPDRDDAFPNPNGPCS